MPPRPSDQPRPRIYVLGNRFRLRPRDDAIGVMVQEKEFLPMPNTGWDTTLPVLNSRTVFGFHTPPFIPALWRSLTTTQPGGFLMRKLRFAQAIFNNFRDLWNDFCLWSSHRKYFEVDTISSLSEFEEQVRWRGLRAAQYQIGYQDPSPEPRWRMKQIIEVKDYSDLDEVFHVYCRNMTW